MVAQALMLRAPPRDEDERRAILRFFADDLAAPFSLHAIALGGALMSKEVGDWFGPNAFAQVFRSLMQSSASPIASEIAVHIAMDMLLGRDDLRARNFFWFLCQPRPAAAYQALSCAV